MKYSFRLEDKVISVNGSNCCKFVNAKRSHRTSDFAKTAEY